MSLDPERARAYHDETLPAEGPRPPISVPCAAPSFAV
ncbi:hypothetical protein [Caldalkalibacillus thermarum]